MEALEVNDFKADQNREMGALAGFLSHLSKLRKGSLVKDVAMAGE